jgi:drug/metabolite transporter (DMT)-like permease
VTLLLLGLSQGASYLFIRVAVRELPPPALMEVRLLFAAPVLLAYCVARGRLREVRASWRDGLVLGVFGVAIPFTLVGWGASHVDAGTTAVANAAVPLFVMLIALKVLPGERATGLRLLGLLLGLAGVALLAGLRPSGGPWGVAGTLAVVAAAPSYALATLFAQRRLATSGLALATGSLVFGALALLPFAIATAPAHPPGARTIALVAVLGVVSTAVPHAAYYWLVSTQGASRSALVTYTSPVFALVLGAVFLGEPTTVPKVGGLVLVVAGVALGSGIRRSTAAAPARPRPLVRRARAPAPNA